MSSENDLRTHLARLLDWSEAHVGFDAAVDGVPAELRGVRPQGLPWSPWELLEHLRLVQRDILEFCVESGYAEKSWPQEFWPKTPAPPAAAAWEESVAAFRADRERLKRLAADPGVDLFAAVPQGNGQTFLRELLLAADHAAYHVGELVSVRRVLGAWNPGDR